MEDNIDSIMKDGAYIGLMKENSKELIRKMKNEDNETEKILFSDALKNRIGQLEEYVNKYDGKTKYPQKTFDEVKNFAKENLTDSDYKCIY